MAQIVRVSKQEMNFIDAIRDNTSRTCQHAGCGRLLITELHPDTKVGFESLSVRGFARVDADERLVRLETDFAMGLDRIANPTKLVADEKL